MYYRNRGLRGLAGSMTVQMPDGSLATYSTIAGLDAAFNQGAVPLPGSTRTVFMNGTLINGCPLNVILGQGWLPGQQAALQAAGITQCLPATGTAAAAAPIATGTGAPTVSQIPAPAYNPGNPLQFRSVTGPAIIPTGTVAPSSPIVVQGPSGPVIDFGVPQAPAPQIAPSNDFSSYLPYVAVALMALSFMKRR